MCQSINSRAVIAPEASVACRQEPPPPGLNRSQPQKSNSVSSYFSIAQSERVPFLYSDHF
jgi:hypothetical protein